MISKNLNNKFKKARYSLLDIKDDEEFKDLPENRKVLLIDSIEFLESFFNYSEGPADLRCTIHRYSKVEEFPRTCLNCGKKETKPSKKRHENARN